MPNSNKTTTKKSAKNISPINPEELRDMISETAYYLAEQRGFEGGCPVHDWLEAEAKIRRIHGDPASNQGIE